jgi:anti-sigma-K factor RskA
MTELHEPFADLAAGWALDALDGEDAVRFARHLGEGCVECGRAVAEYRAALGSVAAELAEPPPAGVREALLARIGAPRRRTRVLAAWTAGMALAASLAAVVTADVVRRGYEGRLAGLAREADRLRDALATQTRTVSDLRRQLDDRERILTTVRAESEEQARTLALLADPATRVVMLAGLAPSPGAHARIVWHPERGGVLVANDLPAVPAGRTYELWAIAGGKPVPAGLFGVDEHGRGTLRVSPIGGVAHVDVFAVTLEPAGGVPSPTGAMYLASKAG